MARALTVPEPNRALTLMYHEVLREEGPASADPYKLGRAEFVRQMEAIGKAIGDAPVGRVDAPETWRAPRPLLLTFDDGQASAYDVVADLFEARGWRAHFFVVTDFIGRPGFLTAAQIRELDRRGHAIGSHTCSHPVPISLCGDEELRREWGESVRILADITGRAVLAASVPGGYYSQRVANAAVEAGIRFLFTSEPRVSVKQVGNCLVLGRYAIRQSTGAARAAALAEGRIAPRWREAMLWNARKVLKRANARAYIRVRRMILGC
ncbi:MAG TPA: polysaccharide deacetylase family protein [Bryobacteraceae bacterium]